MRHNVICFLDNSGNFELLPMTLAVLFFIVNDSLCVGVITPKNLCKEEKKETLTGSIYLYNKKV